MPAAGAAETTAAENDEEAEFNCSMQNKKCEKVSVGLENEDAAKKAVEDVKKGMIEYRADQYGNIHCSVGKVSFDESKLVENILYVMNTLSKAKPSTVKGTYVKNISISTTMGPGIKIDKSSFEL